MSDLKGVEVNKEGELNQIKWRQEIINSVAKKGIVSSILMPNNFGSSDHQTRDSLRYGQIKGAIVVSEDSLGVNVDLKDKTVVCEVGNGQYIRLVDGPESIKDRSVAQALYAGESSIFPVLLERPNEDITDSYSQSPQTIEERCQNSFLIICLTPGLEISYVPDLVQSENNFEATIEGDITTDKFLVVLAAETVYREVAAGFSKDKIPVIKTGEKKVSLLGQENISVPNYEDEIKKWLRASKKPLFLHAVRLPTVEDAKNRKTG